MAGVSEGHGGRGDWALTSRGKQVGDGPGSGGASAGPEGATSVSESSSDGG